MSTENSNNNSDAVFDAAFDVLIDVSLATVALTLGWKYLINSLVYKYFSSTIEKVEEARKVSISDLRSIASESGGGGGGGGGINNSLVFVRGIIKPLSSPSIISQGSGKEGVLLQTTQTSELENFPMVFRTVQTVKTIPFVLVQKNTSDSVVVNMDGQYIYNNRWLSLTKVYNEVQPTISQFLGMNFSYIMKVEEKILPVGTEINAIGNVSISKDGTLKISACKNLFFFLSSKSKSGIELDLYAARSEIRRTKKIQGYLLLGLSVYIILVRYRPHWKACYRCLNSFWRRRRQVRKQSKDDVTD